MQIPQPRIKKQKSPRLQEIQKHFDFVLGRVQAGFSVVEACAQKGIHSADFYKAIDDQQKARLKRAKMALSFSGKGHGQSVTRAFSNVGIEDDE